VDDDMPEALRGKTPAQLAKMYREAQTLIGRQGKELGDYRRQFDQYVQQDLAERRQRRVAADAAAPAPAVKKPEEIEAEFFAKPVEAVDARVSEHPEIKRLREQQQALIQREQQRVQQSNHDAFNRLHPDAREILQDPEFQQWVGASQVRIALLRRADAKYDVAAGNEVFGTWKELKAARAAQAAQTASEAGRALAAAKAKTAEARKQAVKDATVPTGGNASPAEGGSGKKIYRRADIRRLMENDPARYEQLSDEIQLAYAEGRVR
jgi:septum formation inhibitor MinC